MKWAGYVVHMVRMIILHNILVMKTYTEEPTKKTKPTQDYIKSDLKYGVNCIHLAQGKDCSWYHEDANETSDLIT
jgi:hypothetical protein